MEYSEIKSVLERNPGSYVIRHTDGTTIRKRVFVSTNGNICEYYGRSKKWGTAIPTKEYHNWDSLTKATGRTRTDSDLVRKFKKYASKATFTSHFIRKCLNADENKNCYDNGLTNGSEIDGNIISVNAIAKVVPEVAEKLRDAIENPKDYNSGIFYFRGYEAKIYVESIQEEFLWGGYTKGDIYTSFSLKSANANNIRYYQLINDETFIGVDTESRQNIRMFC